ncbi:TetR/AcrR family transcriptional regulator [Myceligenerans pegani]|uniref:TetR/AcrR family transcriptional regulator n=1 Tax=Myceligenerans pegani TaxID=2776917 RepID=A0ABR9MVY9_9MICO|nr:TetR/AcrR family transcriptional regulator [Myceligenerans sp. TRM 65318]MBE1875555.1 TetR/AcrR family transcriptional regulator [Myceligenerans sp. TRM 65318]MBE3017826.1 TetR/AcrR family transcriptional regulator [Myceligenerans sp. TRM 65318]
MAGSRGRPRDAAIDQRILAVTREAVVRQGYRGLVMEQVASAVGVGKQTLYRRWPRRPLLVFEAVFGGGAEAAGILPDTGTLAGDLAAVVEAQRLLYSDPANVELLRGLLADCLGEPELLAEFQRRLVRPRLASLETVARRAADRGELRPEIDTEFIAELIGGFMLVHVLVYGGSAEDFGPALADVVVRGAR